MSRSYVYNSLDSLEILIVGNVDNIKLNVLD